MLVSSVTWDMMAGQVIKEKLTQASMSERQRNPNWSRDETILLLELYRKVGTASRTHADVKALSDLLNEFARHTGASPLVTYRNPTGIAMRLRNLSRLDPTVQATGKGGLRPGGTIDRAVWREFEDQVELLSVEAAQIRERWAIAVDTAGQTKKRSRGPVPSFGAVVSNRTDDGVYLYLLRVVGPHRLLVPDRQERPDFILIKIGRSVDVDRRIQDLSAGYPPGSNVRLTKIWFREFPSAMEAHAAEQSLLDYCEAEGWSLGGEFAYANVYALLKLAGAEEP